MSEREQNLFLLFAFLVVAGFCWLMKLGGDYQEEQILSVRPVCYYKIYKDKTVLASLHLPVNLGGYPDHYGPRLRKEYVSENELFGVPMNEMWGTYFEEHHARVKYREFNSYADLIEELRKVDFMILIYQSNEND